jgi:hypothetical protein
VLIAGTGPKAEKLHARIDRGEVMITTNAGSCTITPRVKYLGSLVSYDGSNTEEVQARISKANGAHYRLTARVWRSSALWLRTKMRLWISIVRSTLLYALEVRCLTSEELATLERWQNKKLRRILRSPARLYHVTNMEIRRRAASLRWSLS